MMTLDDVVDKFNTTPFLFVGSGISRRYLNLPDWRGLLEYFARIISDNDFSYSAYENKAKALECRTGVMPKVAELIQQDYDEKWFANPSIRMVDGDALKQIKMGLSPFKAELARYIEKSGVSETSYQKEIEKLEEISKKSIAGVITTNYDLFLEEHFQGYTTYIGQKELIFSAI